MNTYIDVAWAAGLFEGEGWIGTRKGANETAPRQLKLQIESMDEDALHRFCAIVGCGGVSGPFSRRDRPERKPIWRWQAACAPAARALDLMLPHLGQRRTARAEEVLSLVRG